MKYPFLFLAFFLAFAACQPAQLPVIKGSVVFAGDATQGVANTMVEVVSQNDNYQTVVNADGTFEVSVQPGEYTVRPFKLQSPIGFGLDAADHQAIQRFVLETDTFPTQWQWMAADINRDSTVSTFDAAIVAGVPVGTPWAVQSVHGNGDAAWWTFVPADYVAPSFNGFHVPAYPTTQKVVVADGDEVEVKFVGFRPGDVSMSADPGL